METQKNTVSLYVEFDEDIYECIQDFLSGSGSWDLDSAINAGMSLFLLQNHHQISHRGYQICAQNYLKLICALDTELSQD